tara:strand:+ start:259 stop:1230 length:972 start_codon:yes stop_codon:yes gene_type:complete
MTINTVHNIDFLKNNLPDKCANLIIADPPYYKVKGDFDFIWNSFEDYLKDVEKWCLECKRILKDNGTILWYGDAKNIAYAQIIFDKYFNLLNSVVWENTNDHKQQIRFNEDLRTFAPLTERILMYDNARKNYGTRDLLKIAGESISPFARLMKRQMKLLNITGSELAELQLSKNGNKTGWISNKISGTEIPTPEQWKLLCNKLNINEDYEKLKDQREKEQSEYLKIQRPFNNSLHLGDVIRLPNYETSDYDHDTIKPEKLTRILIRTCSRKGDTLVVPFAGSGTECAMGVKEGLKVYGYEITEKHANMSNERMKPHLTQTSLF